MEKPSTPDAEAPASRSPLRDPARRFLASVVEHALTLGLRTPEDFLRRFPPTTIMEALADEPELRASILEAATGTRAKVALKKPAAACGWDLQVALEEGETDAETVLGLLESDDRVRFLDARALWAFATEGDAWDVDASEDPAAHAAAAAYVGSLLDQALGDGLITARDVVRGITVDALATHLPRPELAKLLESALEVGGFVEESVLAAVPTSTLTQHVPLPWIWNEVMVRRVAERHGLVAKPQTPASPPPSRRPSTVPPPIPPPRAPSAAVDIDVDELVEALTAEAEPLPKQPFRVPSPRVDSTPPPRG